MSGVSYPPQPPPGAVARSFTAILLLTAALQARASTATKKEGYLHSLLFHTDSLSTQCHHQADIQ